MSVTPTSGEWTNGLGWQGGRRDPSAELQACRHGAAVNRIDKRSGCPIPICPFPGGRPGRNSASFDQVKCLVISRRQGETKHWAFKRSGAAHGFVCTRILPLPPITASSLHVFGNYTMTMIQNARTSGGGVVSNIPSHAVTRRSVETWKSEKVSIWHPGWHDIRSACA